MEQSKKQRLEGMLRAVKDLKGEHYIGTQTAHNSVKAVQRVYSRPVEIADKINEELGLNSTHYQATPERLAALARNINEISIDEQASAPKEDDPPLALYKSTAGDLLSLATYPGIPAYLFGQLPVKEEGDVYNALKQLFIDANTSGVKTNRELGEFIVPYLSRMIENRHKPKEKGRVTIVNPTLTKIDWEEASSREKLREYERVYSSIAAELDTDEIVERLKRDGLDHRLEYRRQVLAPFLRSYSGTPYTTIIKELKDRIEKSESRLERPSIKDSTYVRESEERSLTTKKFLRHLLGSDRNFAERFLRS